MAGQQELDRGLMNRRVLIIDDDTDIWKAYKIILAPEQYESFSTRQMAELLEVDNKEDSSLSEVNFELSFASQGRDGYEMVKEALAKKEPYSIAFIDVRMPPGWDGMETAIQIRSIDPDIEIVIVTAFTDRSRDEIARTVRPPDKLLYLRKPFDSDELKQVAYSLNEKWNISRKEEQQREELAAILQTTPAAIFTVDEKRNVTSWNPAAEQITGYSAQEVVGKPCIFMSVSAYVPCSNCMDGDSESPYGKKIEIAFQNRQGNSRIILKNSSGLYDRKGESVGMVESFWDITLRKEAEEALHKSEARYRSLVETTSDWVWEADRQGKFTYCSPVCEELYGYHPEELLGRSMFDILLDPEWAPEFRKNIEICLDNIKGFHGVERLSTKKDGSRVFVESSVTPIVSGKLGVIGFHGIDRDISERKRAEEEKTILEEQYHQAQKLEALGTLAGGVAHDINNLLSPIIGYAELAEMALEKGNGDIAKHLNAISENSYKATELVKQILSFSRKQVLVNSSVNLNRIIEALGKMLSRLIRENIRLEFDLAADLWSIEGDSGRLGQILINLAVNAKDAIVDDGKIEIRTENRIITEADGLFDEEQHLLAGSYVVLTVSDDGCGMNAEIKNRIFDPFFTTKPMGMGTGIGLSTVFGIVKQHDGHILVESEPRRGTTFAIYLPRKEKTEYLDDRKQVRKKKLHGNETVILVEDSETVLLAIKDGLEIFGYRVIVSKNGKEAVKIINEIEEGIDMLITDVVMPGMSGKEVGRVFRAKFQQPPILFISGYSFDIGLHELLQIPRSFFMQKPLWPSEVAARVRGILDGDEKPEN